MKEPGINVILNCHLYHFDDPAGLDMLLEQMADSISETGKDNAVLYDDELVKLGSGGLSVMSDRRYLAVSIKHSSGTRFTLWGWDRTEDEQKRCFSGYLGTMDYDKCELYSLEDFREHYGHGVIKCDCPVEMTLDLVKKWREYDTVLVDCDEYKAFVN